MFISLSPRIVKSIQAEKWCARFLREGKSAAISEYELRTETDKFVAEIEGVQ